MQGYTRPSQWREEELCDRGTGAVPPEERHIAAACLSACGYICCNKFVLHCVHGADDHGHAISLSLSGLQHSVNYEGSDRTPHGERKGFCNPVDCLSARLLASALGSYPNGCCLIEQLKGSRDEAGAALSPDALQWKHWNSFDIAQAKLHCKGQYLVPSAPHAGCHRVGVELESHTSHFSYACPHTTANAFHASIHCSPLCHACRHTLARTSIIQGRIIQLRLNKMRCPGSCQPLQVQKLNCRYTSVIGPRNRVSLKALQNDYKGSSVRPGTCPAMHKTLLSGSGQGESERTCI